MNRDMNIRLVDSTEEAAAMLRWLGERRDGPLALDVETTGLSPERDHIRLCQFGDTTSGWAVPWRDWRGAALDVVNRWDGEWVMHNARFDTGMLDADGVHIDRSRVHDTMISSHLISPGTNNQLKSSAMREFGNEAGKGDRALKAVMTKSGWWWDTIPVDHPVYWGYGVMDTILTARLHEKWWPTVSANYDFAYDVEMASGWVLQKMERRGVRVDPDYLHEQYTRLEIEESELRREAKARWNLDNPTSTRQAAAALVKVGIVLTERTSDGQLKVDKTVLGGIEHPLAELILRVRAVRRDRVNYIQALLDARDSDNIVRCSIHPFKARTGRMSISNPPLQQIPRGSYVRRGFIARDGHSLIGSDFDQIELRLFAHFAQEQAMIRAIRDGLDLHSYVTNMVYGLGLDDAELDRIKEEWADLRQITKAVNFARIFGAGAEKIAWTAGVPKSEIDDFLDKYNQRFPDADRFMSEVVSLGKRREREEGEAWIESWAGKRLPADEGMAYALINYKIQSTAAEIFKVKLIEMDNLGLGHHMVLPVHDEILMDTPTEEAAEVAALVGSTMTDEHLLSVPLTAAAAVGQNWAEVK